MSHLFSRSASRGPRPRRRFVRLPRPLAAALGALLVLSGSLTAAAGIGRNDTSASGAPVTFDLDDPSESSPAPTLPDRVRDDLDPEPEQDDQDDNRPVDAPLTPNDARNADGGSTDDLDPTEGTERQTEDSTTIVRDLVEEEPEEEVLTDDQIVAPITDDPSELDELIARADERADGSPRPADPLGSIDDLLDRATDNVLGGNPNSDAPLTPPATDDDDLGLGVGGGAFLIAAAGDGVGVASDLSSGRDGADIVPGSPAVDPYWTWSSTLGGAQAPAVVKNRCSTSWHDNPTEARWIWANQCTSEAATYFLHRTFDVDPSMAATLVLRALVHVDTNVEDIYINGVALGGHFQGGSYATSNGVDFLLNGPWVAGSNTIAFEIRNTGGPGGFLAEFMGVDGDDLLLDLTDADTDGTADAADPDDDNDGLLDIHETGDTDGDGLDDRVDKDDDNDGILTADENADPNVDGDPADAVDTDTNGTPDYLQAPLDVQAWELAGVSWEGPDEWSTFNRGSTFSAEYIDVDPTKLYTVRALVRSGNPDGTEHDPDQRHYLGLHSYDTDNQAIHVRHSYGSSGSDTTLAAPLNAGDTEVFLTDSTGWYNGGASHARSIAWWPYTDSEGNVYADHTYTRNVAYNNIYPVNGVDYGLDRVTLNQPWPGPDLEAGTAVRNAREGGTYLYTAASYQIADPSTHEFTGPIQDIPGVQSNAAFRPGTDKVKFMVLGNWRGNTGNRFTVEEMQLLTTDDVGRVEGDTIQLIATLPPSNNATPTFNWVQTGGPAVVLSDPTDERPTFVVPTVAAIVDVTFEVTVRRGAELGTTTVSLQLAPEAPLDVAAFELVERVTFGGQESVNTTGFRQSYLSDQRVEVDSRYTYTVRTIAEAGDGAGGAYDPDQRHYVGVIPYDEDDLQINSRHGFSWSNSARTTLAAALNPGDTTIQLTDASGWYAGGSSAYRSIGWFPYESDSGTVYNAYDYSRNELYNNAWPQNGIDYGTDTITLTTPWAGEALAAGTPVRNANPGGGTNQYAVMSYSHIDEGAEDYRGTMSPLQGWMSHNAWRPGTAKIQFLIYANWRNNSGNEVTFHAVDLLAHAPIEHYPDEQVQITATVDSTSTAPITYAWAQTSGPTVTLSDPTALAPTFTTPVVASDTVLTFEVTATQGARVGTQAINIVLKAQGGLDVRAYELIGEGEFQGSSSFSTTSGYHTWLSDNTIPVDTSLSYTVRAVLESGDGAGGAHDPNQRHYVGFAPYDQDDQLISAQYAYRWNTSAETTLAAPLAPGDTEIHLSDATGWYEAGSGGHRSIAWFPYIDNRGTAWSEYGYSRNIAYNNIWPVNGIDEATGVVTLTSPWSGPALDAGTAVRNANPSGGSYHYAAASYAPVGTEPHVFSGRVTPDRGYFTHDSWTPGLDHVRLVVLANWRGHTGNQLNVDRVQLLSRHEIEHAPSEVVTLTAAATTDNGHSPVYSWVQTAGTPVTLSDPTAEKPWFTTPVVAAAEDLVFEVTITQGFRVGTDTITIKMETVGDLPVAGYELIGRAEFAGSESYTGPGHRETLLSDNYVEIDPSLRYTLRAVASSGDGAGGAYNPNERHYIGLAPYDVDRQLIDPLSSYHYNVSARTTLAQPLAIGDTEIVVDDSTGWYEGSSAAYRSFAWFPYIDSHGTEWTDWSLSRNFKYSNVWPQNGIDNGTNTITLTNPWPGPALDAGTQVRNATVAGGSYLYTAMSYGHIGTESREFLGQIADRPFTNNRNSWRPGTDTVRFVVLANWRNFGDNQLNIDQVELLSLEEIVHYPSEPVTLTAATYTDNGHAATYNWTQIAGPTVTIDDPTARDANFITPVVTSETELRFRVTVTQGYRVGHDEVTVLMQPGGDLDVTAYELVAEGTFGGSSTISTTSRTTFMSDQYIDVDPTLNYTVRAIAHNGNGSGGELDPTQRHYIGLAPYDRDNQLVASVNGYGYPGSSDTTLTAPLNPGDSEIHVTNASGWYEGSSSAYRTIAWYPYIDSQGTAWPDYGYSRNVLYGNAWAQNGIDNATNTINLTTPWTGPALAAGTAVRNATPGGGTYLYTLLNYSLVSDQPTEYRRPISDQPGVNASNAWRPGTSAVRFVVLTNWRGNTGNRFNVERLQLLSFQEIEHLPADLITLTAISDTDNGHSPTYAWTQVGGPAVELDDPTSVSPSFVAPTVSSDTTFTFQAAVTQGFRSGIAQIEIVVKASADMDVSAYELIGRGSFSGSPTISTTDRRTIQSDQMFEVDTSAEYTVRAEVWSGDGGGGEYDPNNRHYLGLATYDADGNFVAVRHSKGRTGSETVLVDSLDPGDTLIRVNDASNWYSGASSHARSLAWWPYTDGQGTVWPDFSYTRNVAYNNLWPEGGISGNTIVLNNPWSGPTLPAGTAVRNAQEAGTYLYTAASNLTFGSQRTAASGNVGPGHTTISNHTWRTGTDRVRLLMLANYSAANNRINVENFDLLRSKDLEHLPLEQVTLAAYSNRFDGPAPTYTWTQIAGPAVLLDDYRSATPTFTTPLVETPTVLTFQVEMARGARVGTADVTMTVLPSDVYDISLSVNRHANTPASIAIGQSATFELAVINEGHRALKDVIVEAQLPAGTTMMSASGGGTDMGDGTVRWTVPYIATSSNQVLQVTLDTSSAAAGNANLVAEVVSSSTPDTVDSEEGNMGAAPAEDDESEATVNLEIPSFDVELDIAVNAATPGPRTVGDAAAFDITVSSAGNQDLYGVVVRHTIPAGFDVVNVSHGGVDSGAGYIEWTIAVLPKGVSNRYTVTYGTLGATDGTVTAAAEIWAMDSVDNTDSTEGNMDPNDPDEDDEDTVDLVVINPPRYDVALISSLPTTTPDPLPLGTDVTINVTVNNEGNRDLTSIQVEQQIPAGATFLGADNGGTASGGVVRWVIPSLPAGAAPVTVSASYGTAGVSIGNVDFISEVAAIDQSDNVDSDEGNVPNDGTAPEDDEHVSTVLVVSTDTADLHTDLTLLDTPTEGSDVMWRIVISNNGPNDEDGPLVASGTVENGVSIVSIQGQHWNCVLTPPSYSCQYELPLPVGQSAQPLMLLTTVTNLVDETISHRVTATGTSPGPNTDDDVDTEAAVIQSGLPNAGAESTILVILGGILVVAGAWLVRLGARKPRRTPFANAV